jgi:integrase
MSWEEPTYIRYYDQTPADYSTIAHPSEGEHLIDEVHGEVLDDFRAQLSVGRAVETVRGTLRVVRRLLNFAEDRGHISKAPKVRLPKSANAVSSPRFLTFAESDALMRAAEREPDWWTFIVVGLRTGLRVGELIALRWEDVDFRVRKLRVKRSIYEGVETSPKSGRERDVPLSVQALAALKAHRKRHPNEAVVFGAGDDAPMTRHMVTPALHRFARAAGLETVGPHVLRHSFGSHSAMLGVPVRILQDWMGHASVTQTEAYAKLAPGSGQSLVDPLDRPGRAGRP